MVSASGNLNMKMDCQITAVCTPVLCCSVFHIPAGNATAAEACAEQEAIFKFVCLMAVSIN